MRTTSTIAVIYILFVACGGKLDDPAPAPVQATPAPEEARPSSAACALPTGDVVVSEHAVAVHGSKTGCRLAVQEEPEPNVKALTVFDSDGGDRRRLTDHLTAHPIVAWRGMVAWIGDALVDVEDGKLVARDDVGRGPARELARDVRDFTASHDDRFVVYEDVGGALHAVSIDGRRRVDFADHLGTARVALSRVVTAGPPGSAVAIIRPSGECDHCDIYDLELGGCGRFDVVPLDGVGRHSGRGPAILLDVHRPTARMLVDAWRPDGTHGVQLVDARAFDRPELLLDRAASVKTRVGGLQEVKCEGATGRFSPSGSKVALTLYSGATKKGTDSRMTGRSFHEDHLFDAATKPRELRATSADDHIVEAADDGLLVRRVTPDGIQLAAEGWGEASSRVVAELAGEWRPTLAALGGGAWLAQPLDRGRAPVVVTRAGSTTLETPSELGQVFDHRFSMLVRPEGSHVGPTHLYDTSTLRRTASIPADLQLEALVADGKVLVVSARGTRRMILRAH